MTKKIRPAIFILTFPDGKQYVGQSTNPKSSIWYIQIRHWTVKSRTKLWQHLYKFEHFHIRTIPCALHLLNQVQHDLIQSYDLIKNGLNTMPNPVINRKKRVVFSSSYRFWDNKWTMSNKYRKSG